MISLQKVLLFVAANQPCLGVLLQCPSSSTQVNLLIITNVGDPQQTWLANVLSAAAVILVGEECMFYSGCCLRYSTLQNFIPSTFTFSIEVGDWAALVVAQRMDGWVQVSNSGHTACNISFPPTKRNSKTKGNNCQTGYKNGENTKSPKCSTLVPFA